MVEFHWLWKFLLGMFIAYYIMSPRLRRFTNKHIVWLFHTASPFAKPARQLYKNQEIRQPQTPQTKIKAQLKQIDTYSSNNHISVEEDKLEEWFNDNPDLRKVNEV